MTLVCPAKSALAQTRGILLADDTGRIIYAENISKLFIPASITKLLTSLAALETLGPDYRFPTWAGYDPQTQNLYIKGFGDPLFISEQIRELVNQITRKENPAAVHDIILDQDYFHPGIAIPGTGESKNPYDATTGSLCANFNTIFFKWDKAQKRYISAEIQTPLPDIFQNDIRAQGEPNDRILLSKNQRSLYPGLLIKAFLEEKGVPVTGSVRQGQFIRGDKFIFKSDFTLDEVVEKLLKFSNNFMANQLMLAMGAMAYGAPATLEKGMRYIKEFVKKKMNVEGNILVEGSGLSRDNRLSPEQMLKVLMAFKPYKHLMKKEGNEIYKTGTLSDVRTRAGYITDKNNRLYPFVIMVNHTDRGYADIRNRLKNKVAQVSGGTP